MAINGPNYTGAARPPAGQDKGIGTGGVGSSPAPGVAPTLSVPADNDPNNVATMFTQQYESAADSLAWLHGAIRTCPPIIPVSATSGFSSVTNVALGGTVTPSGTVKIATGQNFVVKIVTGGAVGVAQYQISSDGGNTYGATRNTAASVTDVDTGITLGFVGTFTLNGTAQFHSAYTPVAALVDAWGNIRTVHDHLGYRFGRVVERMEDWIGWGDIATILNADGLIPGSPYRFKTASSTLQWAQIDISVGEFNSNELQLIAGTVNGNYSKVWAPGVRSNTSDVMAYALEWWADGSAFSGVNASAFMGLSTILAGDSVNAGSAIAFTRDNGEANWQCQAGAFGGAITKASSGIAITASPQRFRIEYYSADHPLGVIAGARVALFFINEQMVQAITTNVPAGTFAQAWENKSTAALGGSINFNLGPVRYAYNMLAASTPF